MLTVFASAVKARVACVFFIVFISRRMYSKHQIKLIFVLVFMMLTNEVDGGVDCIIGVDSIWNSFRHQSVSLYIVVESRRRAYSADGSR